MTNRTTDCREIEESFAALLSGTAATDERRGVMRHLADCDSCAELFAIHAELEDVELPEPANTDFLLMRREVLRSIRQQSASGAGTLWHGVRALLARPLPALALLPAALVAAVIAGGLGYGVAVWLRPAGDLGPVRSAETRIGNTGAADSNALAGELQFAATRNQRLEQSADSPYTFSNLNVRELDENEVELSFDVATHLELVRDRRDPLVAEILVQSLINPAPVGTRLEAISLVDSLVPKVRDALIVAMRDDESLAVRLRALAKVSEQSVDATIEEALLGVLAHEESVQMRLMAVDRLTKRNIARARLEEAVLSGQPEPGRAISIRVQDYFGQL